METRAGHYKYVMNPVPHMFVAIERIPVYIREKILI
jgi:hypothetical protein